MESIRNVCILAHVDHGKTSIADNLLYTNGIISTYSAGDLRHLDSTQDEQERGITMKSSCISLKHVYENKLKEKSEPKNYIINLIDSPGHVDFSGEVSTAVKISDNAFIVVDVIEGVSSQTRTVIKQAWKERLNFILVLNKIDRMCLELKMDTASAYNKLEEIIRDVHHIIGEMISMDNREEEEKTDSIITPEEISRNYDTTPFHPLKGTVVFCSAFHQWGFRISDFVLKYSQQLRIDKIDLYKKMWGDYYINSKRKICKGAQSEERKNIFTSFILDPIWSVYKALEMKELDEVVRMMSKLDIKVELKRSNRDTSLIDNIRNVFRKWMPLPTVLLDALIERCPNPREAMTDKKVSLLVPNEKFVKAKEIIKNASIDKTTPTVVFISKFMFQSNSNTDLIGLGRIYSGQVRPEMKVFAFSPDFDPLLVSSEFLSSTPDDFPDGPINVYEKSEKIQTPDVAFVTSLSGVHQFMGHEQIFLPNGAHAGFVVGLTGFSSHEAIRNLTVTANCNLSDCLGLFSFRSGTNASSNSSVDDITNIICVSVEPKKVIFLNELQDALRLLEKADSIARVSLAPTGELLIHAAGEIHLQKCLNELTTRIAPHIELDVSAPIVPFRETVTHRAFRNANLVEDIKSLSEELKILEQSCVLKPTESEDNFRMDNCLNQQGVTDSIVAFIRPPQKTGMKFCCRISVHSLPDALIDWIDSGANLKSLKTVLDLASEQEQATCFGTDIVPIDYRSLSDKLWTTGGKTTQGNLLFSYIGRAGLCISESNTQIDPYSHSILKGFHRALLAGPICQEQLKNIIFILHDVWEEFGENTEVTSTEKPVPTPSDTDDHHFSDLLCNPGQMSSLITKACQVAVMLHPGARLMIAMYKLDLEVRINTYKNLSSLINQLHGQIISQEVNFGNFIVEARLPVIESFGFGDKLRKKTSGEVGLPQLKTICWELLNCPPFLDLNLYKIIADRAENCDIGISQELIMRTQKYINNVRQRKGIQVRQQLIESGTKQRTLNKKK